MTMHDRIGATVRLYSGDGTDDLGVVHASRPVEPDDVVAFEHGPPFRILRMVEIDPGGAIASAKFS
jgi:hypothetical protein